MGIGRHGDGAADFSRLHVIVDGAPQRDPPLLPVVSNGRCRLRASEADKNRRGRRVDRQSFSRTPGTLEMGQCFLERMRAQQTLARHTGVLGQDRRLDQRAGAAGVSRQLRRAILDAVAEKSLEGLCDGRVPACSATWRDDLVKRVQNERVSELVPLFTSGGKRFDHEGLQRVVDGVEQGFFARVG